MWTDRACAGTGSGADDQALLAAAMATGRVREFTLLRRSLADLYDVDEGTP